jgi:predicted glycosyltransferase involved in capsule biosynthesis
MEKNIKMIDLSDVSIITHIRVDVEDRLENLATRNKYLMGLSENAEFILVEDDDTPKVPKELYDNQKYTFIKNTGGFQKNHSYNVGASMASRKYLVFLDVDCLMHPKNIIKASENGMLNDGFVYPFNSFALYLNKEAKNIFMGDPTHETVRKLFDNKLPTHGLITNYGHWFKDCPGGCFMMSADFFKKVNGFNPNYKGWGHEDQSFKERIAKMGYSVNTLGGKDTSMIHLHHGDTSDGEISLRVGFSSSAGAKLNKQLLEKMRTFSPNDMIEYCKTWELPNG